MVIGLNLGTGLLPQTITFPTPAAQVAGDTVTLLATASSGLAVSLGSLTPAVGTVLGTLASALTAGICTLTGNQPGSAQYQPAPQVQVSFAVALAVTLSFTMLAAEPPVADGYVPLPPRALAALGVCLLATMRRARQRQEAHSGA